MRKMIVIVVTALPIVLYADFLSVDLDFKGLSSLSDSSRKLTKMVETMKKIDEAKKENHSNKPDEVSLRPYLNQDTKALEKEYPWLYAKMEDLLMNKENIEAYASDSAYFKRLGDLNGDGIDEVYLHSQARCGASICNYRVYEIDVENRRLREIFDMYNDSNTTKLGTKLSTGWKSISLVQCWGAADCYAYTFIYDKQKKYYFKNK